MFDAPLLCCSLAYCPQASRSPLPSPLAQLRTSHPPSLASSSPPQQQQPKRHVHLSFQVVTRLEGTTLPGLTWGQGWPTRLPAARCALPWESLTAGVTAGSDVGGGQRRRAR
jgi:hypothetical protein